MKRALLALFLALAAPLAHAAAPTDAQIDRLLEVMRARHTLEAILPQVEASQQQMVEQMTAGQPMTDAQRAQLQRLVARTSRSIRDALAWEKLEPVYRDIYRQTFEAQDMDAMIAFYGSPAGQRVLDKMPQAMQSTMAAMQKLLVPMMQQMQQDIAAELQPVPAEPAAK
ncbi:MAG TPA: DUF2059 domain-containing protein [Lysobacter sp.]